MMIPVNVIASFNTDGQIRPLWLQINVDGENIDYKVLESVCPSGCVTGIFSIRFRCAITEKLETTKQEIELNYNYKSNVWTIMTNNTNNYP